MNFDDCLALMKGDLEGWPNNHVRGCILEELLVVSFGALISQKKIQHDSSTPSWSKFEIEFTIGITIGNAPKNRISSKRHFLMVLVLIGEQCGTNIDFLGE